MDSFNKSHAETSIRSAAPSENAPDADLFGPAKTRADEVFKTLNALLDDVHNNLAKLDKKFAKLEQKLSSLSSGDGDA